MALEDDLWSLDYLEDCDDRESVFGVSSFRFKDAAGVVHRVISRRQGYRPVCHAADVEVTTERRPDPGAVTCIQCVGKGA